MSRAGFGSKAGFGIAVDRVRVPLRSGHSLRRMQLIATGWLAEDESDRKSPGLGKNPSDAVADRKKIAKALSAMVAEAAKR
jgi:hypothetical protein